ncbi:MAG: integral rane sensor signal transduction histidine kinase [Rhodospirillales bacterium]|nr:integral rane sensor signal transduction histidine kinase [Rhodospirillales bacterium]
MRSLAWPQDTIARRFAGAVVLAIAATLVLVGLLIVFGGVWAREPLESSGILNEAADIARIIEASPPQNRPALAAAAENSRFHVDWYDAESPVATALDGTAGFNGSRGLMSELLSRPGRSLVAFKPGSQVAPPWISDYKNSKYAKAYILAVHLADGSWLAFDYFNRSWGFSRPVQWAVWIVFLGLSIAIVSAIAARQLSRPIKQLADAVRSFGINPRAPAITESGPRELRQVIATFNAMQAQIQRFVEYRTTMLAAISHDLRTPLTRMRLRGEFIDDEDQRAKLFRDVDEMQTMIGGALAFFREDAVGEATTTFDLPGILHTIANDYADQNIDIGYTGPARAVYRGRPFALKRAVTNLVENSIKYATPPEIELASQDSAFVITVRDSGPGIPKDALEQVFTPYYRLDKSRGRATGGVGLGLTAAQAIVQGHGGEISLRNRPEVGLEAIVKLPR